MYTARHEALVKRYRGGDVGVIGLRKLVLFILTIAILGLVWVACWEVSHRALQSTSGGVIVASLATALVALTPLSRLWLRRWPPAPRQVQSWLERRGWPRPTIYGVGRRSVMVAWRNHSVQPPRTLVIMHDALRAMDRGGDAARDLDALQVGRFLDMWEEVVVRPATSKDEHPTRLRDGLFVVEHGGPSS